MRGIPRPRPALVLDLWALVLTALLCLPALTQRGLGLSGDLVFSPQQPLTPDTLGLGDRLPRAVPLDAVVALLGHALTGDVLFRLAVVAGPLLAGAGAHRLLRRAGALPRAAAVGFAVWNPYVVERLALGQWALLLAYGALFHVASAALALRDPEGEGSAGLPWRTWAWVGLASLTPTGGLLAAGTALVLGASTRGRTLVLTAGCLVLQLPWVLPSVLGAAAGQGTGNASGVAAFRAGPDSPGGTLVSLLGLGGIWDRDSVPTSRLSPLGVLAAVVVVGVVASFVLGGRRATPYGAGRLVPLAAAGLVLALAPRVPGLVDLVTATVAHVPGGGLLRDSQKWLAPYVMLAVVGLGAALDRAVRAVAGPENGMVPVVALLGLLVPFVLLPDGGSVTWPAVRPVTYPSDFAAVRDQLQRDEAGSGRREAMVLLPLRAYRAFDWGNPRTAYDPAFAWFDVPLVASDELVVGRRVVSDDNGQVARVRRALASTDVPRSLGRLGVRWVLVYTDDPATPDLRLSGFEPTFQGHDLLLFRVPGTVAATPRPATWHRTAVVGADGLVLAFWLVALGALLRGRSTDTLRRLRVRRRAI